MSERLSSFENIENKSSDEHLYSDFLKYGNFDTLKYLDGDKEYRESQKQKFLANEIENPILDYPEIDIEKYDEYENGLLGLKQEILNNEDNEIIKQIYRWRINESIAKARMMKTVANGNMHKFLRYNEFLFGKPSPETFAYTINSIKSKATANLESNNIDVRIAATELIAALPDVEFSDFAKLPSQENIDYANAQTYSEIGNLIEVPESVGKLDSAQIKEVFESAIEKIGDDNWKIVIDEKTTKKAINVSQDKQEVRIPEARKVDKQKLEKLVVHEIGTHVLRRVNGERSSLKLLGLGLDRYELGEEGIATMREQAVENKVEDFSGLEGILAVGLALGIDGTPRDFRQVYDILEKNFLFENLIDGKEIIEAHEKSQKEAWLRAVRTFRGSDCKTPGVCFTKDIVYREGNIGIWNVIENNPNEMHRFNVGKYDPANPRHIWVLDQLGISDQDLSDLEK